MKPIKSQNPLPPLPQITLSVEKIKSRRHTFPQKNTDVKIILLHENFFTKFSFFLKNRLTNLLERDRINS